VTPLALAGPGDVLPLAAAAVGLLMLVLWAVSLRIKDVSIVDPAWGPAFVVVALVAFVAGDGDGGRRALLLVLTAAWGVRLGVHLLRRKLGEIGEEDKRYAEMRAKRGEGPFALLLVLTAAWGVRLGVHLLRRKLGEIGEEDKRYAEMRAKRGDGPFALYSLGVVFGFQALLVLIVSLPLQVAADRPAVLSALVVPGVVLWAVGLFFETVGDAQLDRFKADPASKGEVMDHGLWRYTRHPNYFGDFCVWWGLFLVALPAGGLWWTAVGPAVMSLLLIQVSGKGLLEKSIGSRRPGYAEYVERTSGFFPLPPKKA